MIKVIFLQEFSRASSAEQQQAIEEAVTDLRNLSDGIERRRVLPTPEELDAEIDRAKDHAGRDRAREREEAADDLRAIRAEMK